MSCGTCETTEKGKLIGKVSHYFDRVSVAIVELSGVLNIGDTIRIAGGEVNFTQEIDSMEVNHQKIKSAKKGDSIGIKVAEKAKEGYLVYKL
ncbi:hypothetical protein KKD19_06255 [Patescibacteria group bacterium]|nr:hypothetical protein [Patescibacteria group bacterium]MBU4512807.1 hypothetical protein [Patescibacteria group bacterium]MCG2688130.1 hypothetical protein [Candidatus Parcubacteria bacterium]